MKPKLIATGAEAVISLINNHIHKNRIKKSYRFPDLDLKLRKRRTKAEAKIINKLSNIIPVPKIINSNDKENIIMEFIDGKKLSENLENLDYKTICKQIAENISKIHNQDIIHGDLTTSNMIYVENDLNKNISNLQTEDSNKPDSENSSAIDTKNNLKSNKQPSQAKTTPTSRTNYKDTNSNKKNNKVYFIDFGLAFHSHKIEDKAVDLHLLKQALEAKHFKIAEQAIKIIINNYKAKQYKDILERINIIEKRGRYKG
ncbi:MAG: RIO1 family regulatory kinase/ATPase [archaeon]